MIYCIYIGCFEGESWSEIKLEPVLLEPLRNQIFHSGESSITFRWALSEDGKHYFMYKRSTIVVDGQELTSVVADQTSYTHTFSKPLSDGFHTWSITLNVEEGLEFTSSSNFSIQYAPYIIKDSLDNLQAYMDDYLLVAVEFNEPVSQVELNTSITIDNDATLSELETEDQILYYFKIRNFSWSQTYRIFFDSSIQDTAKNALKPMYLMLHAPRQFPQPKCIGWIGGGKDGWQKVDGPEERDTYYGGLADREFSDAQSISLSPDEKMLYIADPPNNRVQRWTTEGIYQGWIGGGKEGWQYGITPTTDWEAPNQLFCPLVASAHSDKLGYLYLTNQGAQTIHKWDISGHAIAWLGKIKTGWQTDFLSVYVHRKIDCLLEDFYFFIDAQADVEGNIYVIDYDQACGRSMITKFSPQGRFIGYIGCGKDGWQTEFDPKTCHTGFEYTDVRYFADPSALNVDSQGNFYICDRYNHWVIKWSKEGNAIGWLGHGIDGWQTGDVISSDYGGHDLHSFSYPGHITIDSVGNLFIADFDNHRVSKWTKDGKAVGWIGHGKDGWQTGDAPEYRPDSDGKGNMEYNRIPGAEGIAVDSHGTIYVSGTSYSGSNRRVSKWVMDDGEGGGGTPVEE